MIEESGNTTKSSREQLPHANPMFLIPMQRVRNSLGLQRMLQSELSGFENVGREMAATMWRH